MIVIGHPWIPYEPFKKVYTKEDIMKSSANEVVLLKPLDQSHDLARYCQANQIPYALSGTSPKEAIFANALEARYFVCSKDEAATLQPLAETYLFDTKIIAAISNEADIDTIAKQGIDGILFPEAVV